MYCKLTNSYPFKLILSGIVFLGMSGCGLKFGADARQAAENSGKDKPTPKFVLVDNTKTEPKAVAAKSPIISDTKSKVSPSKDKKGNSQTAEYVRMGKNRRLVRKVSNDDSNQMDKQSAVSPIEQVKSTHKTIKNAVRSSHEKVMTKLSPRKPVKQKVLYPSVQLYGAKLNQSEWLLSSKELECSISQPIPRIGKAKFTYNPVQKLRFIYEVNHPPARNLEKKDKRYSRSMMTDKYPYPQVGAKLESIPPNWKPFAIEKMLGYIPFKEGNKPFILPHRQRLVAVQESSEIKRSGHKVQTKLQVASITTKNYLPEIWPDRLMSELEEGMTIRLTYRDWTDGTQDIITSISSINFLKVKGDFEKCINKLPIYNFKKFKQTKLHFTKKQRKLSKKMRTQLRNMVKFIKLDETIKKVMIKSYTDSMGFKRVNREDAKIQARAIKSYMKKLGMSVPITAIGIGEGPFVGSNRSSAGRAQNRRSIITLTK